MVQRVYNEGFHEFIEVYGELLDQVEDAKAELEGMQEEMASLIEEVCGGLASASVLLKKMEGCVFRFRSCPRTGYMAVGGHRQTDGKGTENDDTGSCEEDPFSDIWRKYSG